MKAETFLKPCMEFSLNLWWWWWCVYVCVSIPTIFLPVHFMFFDEICFRMYHPNIVMVKNEKDSSLFRKMNLNLKFSIHFNKLM